MSEFLDPNDEIKKYRTALPHWEQNDTMQFATFRLGDAMPAAKIATWKEERDIWLQVHPQPWDDSTTLEYHRRFTQQLEQWLDQGSGSCILNDPSNRKILEDVFRYDEPDRVTWQAWIIMPNHVHLLFTPKAPLAKLMRSWKGIAARRIGKGSIWQRNYRDTLIRDSEHFANAVRYIRRNPKHLPPHHYTLWESPRAKGVPE